MRDSVIRLNPEPGNPNFVGPAKCALVNAVTGLVFRRGGPYLTLGASAAAAVGY
jgi:hypothetical protein